MTAGGINEWSWLPLRELLAGLRPDFIDEADQRAAGRTGVACHVVRRRQLDRVGEALAGADAGHGREQAAEHVGTDGTRPRIRTAWYMPGEADEVPLDGFRNPIGASPPR